MPATDFIKEILGPIDGGKPEHTFWYIRPEHNFPPKSIVLPEQYDGSNRLNLACTQTDLKPAKQRQLVEAWCELLPTLNKVEFLWLPSRVPQKVFEAVCNMDGLIGLWIKWSGISDLAPIEQLQQLRFLHVGSSPSATSLEVLGHLPNLDWLELASIRAMQDLNFLCGIEQLKALKLSGDTNSGKVFTVDSFEPMQFLQELEWLYLESIRCSDQSLEPLGHLGKLKQLMIGNYFLMEEVAALAANMPHLDCGAINPIFANISFEACKRCGQNSMIMPTGKGKRLLCTECDADKIQSHIDEFQHIVRTTAAKRSA